MKNKQKLYMLHFAGGNKYSFRPILDSFNEFDVEVLELPGRGKRMLEKLVYTQTDAVNDLYAQIVKENLEHGFLIYGHSLGATLGLRLCSKLIANGILPKGLIVTGNPGPGIRKNELRYNLPKEEFVIELKKLGGIPNEVYESEELFSFFEPIIRADFQVVELDDNEFVAPINIPVYAIMGSEEEYVKDIDNWRKFTTSNFESDIWEGNHFFIFKNGEKLAKKINEYFLKDKW